MVIRLQTLGPQLAQSRHQTISAHNGERLHISMLTSFANHSEPLFACPLNVGVD